MQGDAQIGCSELCPADFLSCKVDMEKLKLGWVRVCIWSRTDKTQIGFLRLSKCIRIVPFTCSNPMWPVNGQEVHPNKCTWVLCFEHSCIWGVLVLSKKCTWGLLLQKWISCPTSVLGTSFAITWPVHSWILIAMMAYTPSPIRAYIFPSTFWYTHT